MTDNADTLAPTPDITELNRPYWDELAAGALTFQRCKGCGCAWLPVRSECPQCLANDWGRERAAGGATLVSWVVYHHAYHPAFAQRLPYVVAVVQLDEGPRMISNIVGGLAGLRIDQRLALKIEEESGMAVPRFVPSEAAR